MKTFTRLFITVVAGVLTLSCVTDTTEDQAVQLGSGQTTLSISLDGSRTHLGENTGDGYPLYWSAGDKVAVNGYTSAEIASQYVGTSGAEFTFNTSELGDTYNLVYPAPAEDVTASATAGQYPVVFPASQSYNAANPAEVAAPMYGNAPAGETMTLQHLSGVLRFLIKGNGEVLESIEIRSESGKIAGIFDVNCADGTLTAREDAGNTVTVSFGEGLTLGEEATIVHVAVPSGNYGIFAVILHTASDSMVLNFDSSAKPINKGRVREFSEFTYKANADNGGVYIIDSKEDLIRFAKIASKFQEYTTYTSAKVAANIDMKGVEWTPIEGFDGAFDGGSEEGYEIQNLTAPLFGTTTATEIKNVKLTGVNINQTKTITNIAALACRIENDNTKVNNCSVSGSINVNITATATTNVAGIVAYSTSEQTFTNLTNEANITVKGSYGNDLVIAGCVVRHTSGSLSDIRNLGTVTYAGTKCSGTFRMSGVVDYCINLTNGYNGCDNATNPQGSVIISGTTNSNTRIGGVMAQTLSSTMILKNCINYGEVKATESAAFSGTLFLGGVNGLMQYKEVTYDSCENRGKLTVEAGATIPSVKMGGIIGQTMKKSGAGLFIIANGCINSGALSVASDVGGDCQIAGFVANYSTGMTNASTGVVKNTGNITYSGKATGTVRVAGLIAAAADALPTSVAESVLRYENTGDITVTGTGSTVYVGGVYGNNNHKFANVRSVCNIKAIEATSVGLMYPTTPSQATTRASNCHVGGTLLTTNNESDKITITEENYTGYFYGTLDYDASILNENNCGWLANIYAVPIITGNFENIGSAEELLAFDFSSNKDIHLIDNIDLTGKSWTPKDDYTGTLHGNNKVITGLTAPLFGTVKSSILDLRLEGVNINETVNANIGAFARKIDNTSAIFTNCSASGSITVNPATAPTANVFIAGLIGETTSTKEIYDVTNEVNIEVQGSYEKVTYCAGCISSASRSSIRKATNLGNITFKGTASSRVAISGISSNCLKLTDCTNGDSTAKNTKGNLTYDSTADLTFYAGGMVQGINGVATYTDCANYGKISTTATSKLAGVILGGLFGNNDDDNARVYDNCCNYGDIDISAESTSGNIKVGGIISQIGGNGVFTFLNNITNEGAVNVSVGIADVANGGKTTLVGGIAGALSSKGSYFSNDSNCTIKNTGAISYSANTSNAGYTKVAGLFAHNVPNHLDSENYKLINNGDITAEGAFGDEGFVSGIIGNERHVYNAKCHCNIVAVGYTYVGMIMGSSTSTYKAVNCFVGGSIATRTTAAGESERPYVVDLSASNYFNYIYDDGYDLTTCTDNYYGCGYIESIDDATPEYATQPAE